MVFLNKAAATILAISLTSSMYPSTNAFAPTSKSALSTSSLTSSLTSSYEQHQSISKLNMSKPKSGDIVSASFNLKPNGDFIPNPLFDDGEIKFLLDGGNYLPAIHKLLPALSIGETSDEVVLDAGWGDRREELIAQVPISSSGLKKEELKIGMELYLANGMQCRITEVGDEDFTIDANPPLAGASYTTKVTLNGIEEGPSDAKFEYHAEKVDDGSKYEVMTIALGCFWGGELEFMRVPGVVATSVGYTQGEKLDPTYQEVCSGTTGHTEAIQVIYDPEVASYESLVTIGLERLGDSRNLKNQVGNDRGTQYR